MNTSQNSLIFRIAGVGALISFVANILDVVLGFGGSEVTTYGKQSAVHWFSVYQQSWFKGMYTLGIFNIVYMIALVPVYLGMVVAHLKKYGVVSILIMTVFMIAISSYISSNAAIPMYVLSTRY